MYLLKYKLREIVLQNDWDGALFENSKFIFVYVVKDSQLDKTSFQSFDPEGTKVLLGKVYIYLSLPLKL